MPFDLIFYSRSEVSTDEVYEEREKKVPLLTLNGLNGELILTPSPLLILPI